MNAENKFHNSKISFQLFGRMFILLVMLLPCWQVEAQRALKGIITTEGEAMIGASVFINGTPNGTLTDIDGKFQISQLPKEEFSLVLNPCCTCFNSTSIPIAANVQEIKVDCHCKKGKAIVLEKVVVKGEEQWRKRKTRIKFN